MSRTASDSPTAARVLVVDDDDDVRLMLAEFLRTCRYEVRGAADGNRALELAGPWRPDVVVLDVMMPPPDGYTVCARLKEAAEPPAVLMLSARLGDDHRRRALNAGADLVMGKPFDPAALLDEVAWLRPPRDLSWPVRGDAGTVGRTLAARLWHASALPDGHLEPFAAAVAAAVADLVAGGTEGRLTVRHAPDGAAVVFAADADTPIDPSLLAVHRGRVAAAGGLFAADASSVRFERPYDR